MSAGAPGCSQPGGCAGPGAGSLLAGGTPAAALGNNEPAGANGTSQPAPSHHHVVVTERGVPPAEEGGRVTGSWACRARGSTPGGPAFARCPRCCMHARLHACSSPKLHATPVAHLSFSHSSVPISPTHAATVGPRCARSTSACCSTSATCGQGRACAHESLLPSQGQHGAARGEPCTAPLVVNKYAGACSPWEPGTQPPDGRARRPSRALG